MKSKYMVFANSNSKLTKAWAFHKSQQNFSKLPLVEQARIYKENKSWIGYFTAISKLGLITPEQAQTYKKYVLDKKLHHRNLSMEELKNA